MATTPGYIFGAGTGIATPEELANRRRWAQAMTRSATERTPQDPWEGLASLARAVSGSYSNFKADEEEQKGVASAESAYKPIADALVSKTAPSGEDLNAALANPWMSDGQKLIAQQLFKNQYGDADQARFGLNPIWGKDEQGNTVLFQLPQTGGAPVQVQFPKGVTPSPGVSYQDFGTFIRGSNSKTGETVSETQKDIAGKAAQEEIGTAQGKAVAAAPGDFQAGQNALDLIESIRVDPNKGWGTGFSSIGNMVPGTPGYDFENKVNQAKSGAFLTAIQQMRGLGALSNAEGSAATAAITRMNTATSEAEFDAALSDYEKIVRQGMDRAQKKMPQRATPTVPTAEGASPLAGDPNFGKEINGYPLGKTATNKQTGERLFWDGNNWMKF